MKRWRRWRLRQVSRLVAVPVFAAGSVILPSGLRGSRQGTALVFVQRRPDLF